jgi:hypothetical protein
MALCLPPGLFTQCVGKGGGEERMSHESQSALERARSRAADA